MNYAKKIKIVSDSAVYQVKYQVLIILLSVYFDDLGELHDSYKTR